MKQRYNSEVPMHSTSEMQFTLPASLGPAAGMEYCLSDNFAATCREGKEVRVLWALLGRMRQGRCITDYQHLDCYNDVSSHLRNLCSGKRHCTVSVGSLGPLITSCPTNILSYLQADYDCVDGRFLLHMHIAFPT